jgi:WD40 repeat protein
VAFGPDGTLAVGDDGGTVTLWNASNPARQPSHLTTHGSGAVYSVAFSPHGAILAMGTSDHAVPNSDDTVTLWNVGNPAQPRQLSQLSAASSHDPFAVPLVTFSPDGTTLAVADGDTVTLWDVANPAQPRQLSHLTLSGGVVSDVFSLAFTPDGTTLAAGVRDGVTLWDVGNPAQPRQLSHLALFGGVTNVFSVAFSPDGTTLAAGDDGGTVTLWNVGHPAQPRQLSHLTVSNGNWVYSVAFSPDGTLAVGDGSGTVTLWDASSPVQLRQLGQPLSIGHGNSVNSVDSVAFSPDGTLAVSGSGTIQVWQGASYATSRICDLTAGLPTPQQWRQYIPQLPYDPPCSRYR